MSAVTSNNIDAAVNILSCEVRSSHSTLDKETKVYLIIIVLIVGYIAYMAERKYVG